MVDVKRFTMLLHVQVFFYRKLASFSLFSFPNPIRHHFSSSWSTKIGDLGPRFTLISLLNFTILTLFNLNKLLIVMEIKIKNRSIKINKSLLIFLLNFTKQINRSQNNILTLFNLNKILIVMEIKIKNHSIKIN